MNKTFLIVSLFFSLLFTSGAGYSQADSLLNSSPIDVEEEYRKELDQWILRAYEGDRDAQFKVGVLFTNGDFDAPDHEQAVYWYKQASLQGHALAQYNLGHQYLAGLGVERSEKKAMEWWLKAAMRDHALAQFNVGRGYYLGIGLDKNHRESKMWFERAAKNGEPKSIDILKQIKWSEEALAAEPAESRVSSSDIDDTPHQTTSKIIDDIAEDTPLSSVVSAIEEPKPTRPILQETPVAKSLIPRKQPRVQTPVVETPIAEAPSAVAEALVPENIQSGSISVFTNPKVRSRLITVAELQDDIRVESRSGEWASVRSNKGLPVWVHGDFVKLQNGVGQITGSNVNARSEPKISEGSIVGRLNKGETLAVLQSNQIWHRLVAPTRFTAWVKTQDLDSRDRTASLDGIEPDKLESNESEKIAQLANTPAPLVDVKEVSVLKTSTPRTDIVKPESLEGKAVDGKGIKPWNDSENNAWLFSQSPGDFTLQLASFSINGDASQSLNDSDIHSDPNLRAFKSSQDDNNLTYYLYGSFTNKRVARKAKKGLNLSKAWVRSFEELQQNRCVTWKTQLPTPPELSTYCIR